MSGAARRAWKRKFRVTLWGRDGVPIPLSRPLECREGIFLESIPEGFSGFDVDHLWDVASGTWRGTAKGENSFTLPLIVKGTRIREHINNLLDQLEAGRGIVPASLVVMSPDHGYRWVRVRLQQVSKIDWYGSPGSSPMAKFSLILEYAGWTTRRFPERIKLDQNSEFGQIMFMVDGDRPVWPKFDVIGKHDGVRIRLTADDEWQTLPYQEEGWVVDSHPERRIVTNWSGTPTFSTIVPFWPEPVKPWGPYHECYVEVEAKDPGEDFHMTIEYVPESSRLW